MTLTPDELSLFGLNRNESRRPLTLLIALGDNSADAGRSSAASLEVRRMQLSVAESVPFDDDGDAASRTFLVRLHDDLVPAAPSEVDIAVDAGNLASDPGLVAPVLESLRLVFEHPARLAPFSTDAVWARTFGALISGVTGTQPSPEIVGSARRAQVVRIVERYGSDPRLTPETLAHALAVSRRTLYELTGSIGGISEYIRLSRARRAIDMLSDRRFDGVTLTQIASDAGFSSPKQLTRTLATTYGTSPAAVRRARGVVSRSA